MSNIVERAREMHALAGNACDPAYNRILLQMADEIERLQATLLVIADNPGWLDHHRRAQAALEEKK